TARPPVVTACATPATHTLSLHDALPIYAGWLRLHVHVDERVAGFVALGLARAAGEPAAVVTTSGTAVANLHPAVLEAAHGGVPRSEEHTSELQSRENLVCRLLLEKKKPI